MKLESAELISPPEPTCRGLHNRYLCVAEGEELGSNLLVQNFARFRAGSLPEGGNTLRPTGRAPWPGDLRQLSGHSRHPSLALPNHSQRFWPGPAVGGPTVVRLFFPPLNYDLTKDYVAIHGDYRS